MRQSPGRLHLLTDDSPESLWSPLELAALAVEHGVDVLQYRDKRPLEESDRRRQIEAILTILQGSSVRLVVNDHPALAASCGADGVHVGAKDATPTEARSLVGPDRCVGATANDLERAIALCAEPIDYLGVGPAFGTRSKAHPAPTLGPAGIREIVRAVDRPVIAIGSIGAENCESVLNCGVWGVAVLSAVSRTSAPTLELKALRQTIDQLRRAEVN